MHLVPGRDLLDRLVATQRLKRNLGLEIRREPDVNRRRFVIAVFLLKGAEYTLNHCPISWDHLSFRHKFFCWTAV
jgi:hypothetical protein